MSQRLILYLLRGLIHLSLVRSHFRLRRRWPRGRLTRWSSTTAGRARGGVRRVFAVPVVAATVVLGGLPLLGTGVAAADPPKGTVKIVVLGDSYTSGEGANGASYRTRPVETVTEVGPVTVEQVDPAHQSNSAPALRAIEQLRRDNPGVTYDVDFVAISGATRDSLYQTTAPGTPFEHPAQIDQVKSADIVILGIGGNDARFSEWGSTVWWSRESTSERAFPGFMATVQDPAFLQGQVQVYNDVLSKMSPNGTLLVTGYPLVLPETVPSDSPSPVSYLTISSREAQLSNQLGTAINQQVQRGAELAGETAGQRQVLFLDNANVFDGNRLFSPREAVNGVRGDDTAASYHPNDFGQELLGNAMRAAIDKAVNRALNERPAAPPDDPQQGPKPDQQQPDRSDQQQQPGSDQQQPDRSDRQQPDRSDQQQPGSDQRDQQQPGGGPDQQQPGGDQPDQQQPGAGQPDQQQSGAGQPDQQQSGAGQPDQQQPGAGQPDQQQPGAGQPDQQQPGAGQPDQQQPGAEQPGQPDQQQPGAGQPDQQQPGAEQPDQQQPGAEQRGEQPGVGQPDQQQPGVEAPAERPGVDPAGQQADDPTAPQQPAAEPPAAEAPAAEAPAAEAPAAEAPAAEPPVGAAAPPADAVPPADEQPVAPPVDQPPAAAPPVDQPPAAAPPAAEAPAAPPPVEPPPPVIIEPPAPPPVIEPPPPPAIVEPPPVFNPDPPAPVEVPPISDPGPSLLDPPSSGDLGGDLGGGDLGGGDFGGGDVGGGSFGGDGGGGGGGD